MDRKRPARLAQVAMKLGEAIYKDEQGQMLLRLKKHQKKKAPADDNVVDAEFSEVDEDADAGSRS